MVNGNGNGHGSREDGRDEYDEAAEALNELAEIVDCRPWPSLDNGLGNICNVAALMGLAFGCVSLVKFVMGWL